MKDFLKGSLRTAVSIFLALLGLSLVVGAYSVAKEFYSKQQSKPYEQVRAWRFDLKDSIGLDANARTKFVDGKILVSVEVLGYPKYLANPQNAHGSLIFEFLDQDGFKLVSKSLQLSDFTTIVNNEGKKSGLSHQFTEYIDLDRYKQLNRMQVGWNLITEVAAEMPAPKPVVDHCAPNLSRSERLKRLGQFGTVRETGMGRYSASGHSVNFLTTTGELLSCY